MEAKCKNVVKHFKNIWEKNLLKSVENQTGEIITNTHNVMKRWKKYYKNLLDINI